MWRETPIISRLCPLREPTRRAEPLFRRALAIDEASFKPDHPDVGLGLNNLATLLHYMGRPAEAEPLMRRALAIFETSLGPDHPSTVIVRKGLARLEVLLAKGN